MMYWYFSFRTSIHEWFERNPYLSTLQSLCKMTHDFIKNTVYNIPRAAPPHVKWCNTISIYKNDRYRTSNFTIMNETYTIHPLFQPLYFMLHDTISLVSTTCRRKWGVLENPFFFQKEGGKTEKIELDNQVEKANEPRKKKTVYYSVPDGDIGIAERTVLEMKKNPILK